MSQFADTTLALLAGGEGSRMGRPKGELCVNGVPLAKYLWEQIAWPGPTLLVTAPGRERPPGAEVFDREVTDPVFGEGPLRGALTALERAAAPLLLLAAIDMPRIGREQLEWLATQLRDAPGSAGMMCRKADGAVEPLPCVFRPALALPLVRDALRSGRRSLRSLLDAPNIDAAAAPTTWPEGIWTNTNDPEAWAALLSNITT